MVEKNAEQELTKPFHFCSRVENPLEIVAEKIYLPPRALEDFITTFIFDGLWLLFVEQKEIASKTSH